MKTLLELVHYSRDTCHGLYAWAGIQDDENCPKAQVLGGAVVSTSA
jgi:hypothetical protein